MTTPARQYVRFLFLKLDAAWRRLEAAEQSDQKLELGQALLRHHARLLLRSYSLSGTRADADFLLWQVADDLEPFQGVQTEVFSTRLGGYLSAAHSFLGVTRRSIYELPPDPAGHDRVTVRPQDARYLFVYPFVKTRAWYALPMERRQTLMEEHVRIGRRFPNIRLNTIYSFGLDDQEFVVAFEGDDPAEFVTLVMELRESGASEYTLRDTPTFTCIQMSLWDTLDSLGGARAGSASGRPVADGFVAVARREALRPLTGLRVYHGADAIALFEVDGRVYAVNDRCPHGRASLSEGRADPETCRLTCPWHGGVFDLRSGAPCAGPPRAAVATYEVRVDDGWILVR